MFNALRNYLIRWLGIATSTPLPPAGEGAGERAVDLHHATELHHPGETHTANLVPYDENLLERSRTQWQFGDWESLVKLDRDTLQHHPDRAKLALLSAAGLFQQGDDQAARQFARLAQDWGCSKKLISQILIAGVHNTLGRVATLGGQQHQALQHFGSAIAIGMPCADNKLLSQARIDKQHIQLGILNCNFIGKVDAGATPHTLSSREQPIKDYAEGVAEPGKIHSKSIAATRELQEANNKLSVKVGKQQDELKALKAQLEKIKSEKGGLDEMIADLEPFFYGRRLTYVDVGAYIGDVFLKLCASNLRIREAHLVEPNPKSYAILLEKTAGCLANGSLQHYNVALAATRGEMFLRQQASMTKVIKEVIDSELLEDSTEKISVSAITLDSLIEKITEHHVDLLKIDVEGFEDQVLLGADRILTSQLADLIIVEVGMNPDGTQQCYYHKIDDILGKYGYRLFRIYEQMFEWIKDSPFLRRSNFVYMSPRFASANPYRLRQELFKQEKKISELSARISTVSPEKVK